MGGWAGVRWVVRSWLWGIVVGLVFFWFELRNHVTHTVVVRIMINAININILLLDN